MKSLLLFDVDGTIAESGSEIDHEIYNLLKKIDTSLYDLGIVGGGVYPKIKEQIKDISFTYIFSECGSVYHYKDEKKYENSLIHHEIFPYLYLFIKKSFEWIQKILKEVSGHFIDVRNGLLYISLIGMQATKSCRESFYQEEKKHHYREKLLQELKEIAIKEGIQDKITITLGGSTGIAIYPKEWSKVQILNVIYKKEYEKIYYFGDRYEPNGNDYDLIHHSDIIGMKVDSLSDTKKKLEKILSIK